MSHRQPHTAFLLRLAIPALMSVVTAADLLAQRGGSPADEGRRAEGKNGAVTSANGLASEAGVQMLRAGGNAVDAAVATAFAIGVVEPQMSGLGGSGSATIYMKREGKPAYLDFYAAQPVDAWRGHPSLTTPAPGPTTSTGAAPEAEASGDNPGDLRVVGVPGAVAGLLELHERYGALPRAQVMAPAIRLAEEGYPVGQILADFIASGAARMKPFPAATALYIPTGKPLAPGDMVKNPALAASLRRISEGGRTGFYEGPTATALVAALNAGGHPLRLSDLASYAPQWKRPLCTAYRGFSVLSAPPPQTGHQILHALELLEPFNLKTLGLPTQSARAFDVLASALRAGQSQQRFNADPNWAAVPANGLTSSLFAASRSGVVGSGTAATTIAPVDAAAFDTVTPPGECRRHEPYPPAVPLPAVARDQQDPADAIDQMEGGETTHLSVVDKAGNAVALTVTNSSAWGSGGMVEGFMLNNSGFRFTERNINAPRRSEWRIRNTTIAPTIVLRGNDVEVVIGAPGAGRIPTEILQVLVYIVDHGLDPLDAVRIPRIFTSAATPRVQLEHGFSPELLREVRSMGYEPVAESAGYARLYLIARRGGAWVAVADPRHDGQPRAY